MGCLRAGGHTGKHHEREAVLAGLSPAPRRLSLVLQAGKEQQASSNHRPVRCGFAPGCVAASSHSKGERALRPPLSECREKPDLCCSASPRCPAQAIEAVCRSCTTER